jgi:putative LysE/RhtB family amino acid efflux pump
MSSAATGFGLGFLVALQLGPMSLFLIRSTLRDGWRVGLAAGAGIAAVDGLYAACGAAGAAPLLQLGSLRTALGLCGAALLVLIGVRTLRDACTVRLGLEPGISSSTPRRAFLTALAGTASNPATVVSWAAIFAAASVAGAAAGTSGATLLVAGVAIGSLTWVSALATLAAAARRRIGPRALRAADAVAGVALLGYGAALGYAAARER